MKLKIGKYYQVTSDSRLGGNSFIGKLHVVEDDLVCFKIISTKVKSWFNNQYWWTWKDYVLREVDEDEAVLEMLGD